MIRRTITSREAAETAFKAATTKPVELPPTDLLSRASRSRSRCGSIGMFLIISKRAGRVGKIESMRCYKGGMEVEPLANVPRCP